MGVKSQEIIDGITVFGRTFDIELTTWTTTEDLSWDVIDTATGQCITAESFDANPAVAEVEALLRKIASDRAEGFLDAFFFGGEANLDKILAAIPRGITVSYEGQSMHIDLPADDERTADEITQEVLANIAVHVDGRTEDQ